MPEAAEYIDCAFHMNHHSINDSRPPQFTVWTRQALILAVKIPDEHSITQGFGSICYTRSLRTRARIVIHLPNIPFHQEYVRWASRVPPAWVQGDIMDLFLVHEQTWAVQRPNTTPQAIGKYIHEHGRPPLDSIQFFTPLVHYAMGVNFDPSRLDSKCLVAWSRPRHPTSAQLPNTGHDEVAWAIIQQVGANKLRMLS